MQEHPVPRQITTFEFKLIGEMTVKQFGYIAFAAAFAVIIYFLVPNVFFLNLVLAAIPALLGIGFAFVPINDRPMDLWLRNLFKRLFSPTQYYYRKNNPPPKILLGLQLPPREILLQYIKAQQSLNEYLEKKPKVNNQDNVAQLDANFNRKLQVLSSLFISSPSNPALVADTTPARPTLAYTPVDPLSISTATSVPLPEPTVTTLESGPALALSGIVTTATGVALANQMVYVKQGEETVRLFKTDAQGRFQNNLPLAPGDYFLEVVDPQKKHNFDRMKIDQQSNNLQIMAEK